MQFRFIVGNFIFFPFWFWGVVAWIEEGGTFSFPFYREFFVDYGLEMFWGDLTLFPICSIGLFIFEDEFSFAGFNPEET